MPCRYLLPATTVPTPGTRSTSPSSRSRSSASRTVFRETPNSSASDGLRRQEAVADQPVQHLAPQYVGHLEGPVGAQAPGSTESGDPVSGEVLCGFHAPKTTYSVD